MYAELDEKLIENEHGVLFIEIGRDENDEPHFWLVDHDILDALHKMCMNLNEELIQYADQIWE